MSEVSLTANVYSNLLSLHGTQALIESIGQSIQTLKLAYEGINLLARLAEQAKMTAISARLINEKISSNAEVSLMDSFSENGAVFFDDRDNMSRLTIRIKSGTPELHKIKLLIDNSTYEISFIGDVSEEKNLEAVYNAILEKKIAGLNVFVVKNSIIFDVEEKTISICGSGKDGSIANTGISGELAIVQSLTAGESIEDLIRKINSLPNVPLYAQINVDNKLEIVAALAKRSATYTISIRGGVHDKLEGFVRGINQVRVNKEVTSLRARYAEQYSSILSQIDMLAKDSEYNGINLLQEDCLKVVFNEEQSSVLEIRGVNASCSGLGLNSPFDKWKTIEAIENSIYEIENAVFNLKKVGIEFCNSYFVVKNHENFTRNLINLLA